MYPLAFIPTWLPPEGLDGGFLLRIALGSLVILAGFAVAAGWFVGLSYLFSLPMRRRERTRLFLDLIEGGLRRGQSIEHTITGVLRSGDRSLGGRFRRMAGLIERGLRFENAVVSEATFLPRETAGLMRAGCEAGDVLGVLPACREPLRDGVAEVAKAHHYFALLAFVVTPAWVAVLSMLVVFVAPKLNQVAEDMGVGSLGWLNLVVGQYRLLIGVQLGLLAILWFMAALYLGGPRLRRWLDDVIPGVGARLAWWVPWRRRRLQRDFSAALATLLDAGVPEARAVRSASEATGNEVLVARASRVIDELAKGVALPTALELLDDTGELRWRLTNASHGGGGFAAALAGWHQALDAWAFQGEQVFAQAFTTGLVLVNGLAVLLLGTAMFQMFTALIQEGVLW